MSTSDPPRESFGSDQKEDAVNVATEPVQGNEGDKTEEVMEPVAPKPPMPSFKPSSGLFGSSNQSSGLFNTSHNRGVMYG